MKKILFLIIFLPVLTFGKVEKIDITPVVGVDEISTECGSTTATIELTECSNIFDLPLSHVVWEMADGSDPITTNGLSITHDFPASGVYHCTATAYYLTNNGVIGSNVFANCETMQGQNVHIIAVSILAYDGTLALNPSGSFIAGNDYDVILNYDQYSTGVITTSASTYTLKHNGVTIASGTLLQLPDPGSVIGSITLTEGENTISYVFDYKTDCIFTSTLTINTRDCCNTFKPIAGTTYWVSAWVKEERAQPVKNYASSFVELEFITTGTAISPVEIHTTGEIIDGWQRIVGSFVMPAAVSDLKINLVNNNFAIEAFFDDIRIHPFNASMKSYVYDPETNFLSAELDDNNYATFYEYDNEGQLVRVKKETARGIMTIQETRSNNPKKL